MPSKDKPVLVESYPAIYPKPSGYAECEYEHCRDAWKVSQWMLREANEGSLKCHFEIAPKPFGRVEEVSFEDQVRFEGWIFGVS